jgi:HTH-type transcriptional regulator, sugar sensing transcriptional regulator
MEIVQHRVIELLQEMGLTEYESEAYAILAFAGPMKAVEVAKLTKIPRPRIYDTLKRLEARRYIKKGEGEEAYSAVPPSNLVEQVASEEAAKEKRLDESSGELIKELASAYLKAPKEKELSYAIKGRQNIAKKLLNMVENAKRACIMTSYAHSLVLKRPDLLAKLGRLEDLKIITTMEPEEILRPRAKIFPVREEFGMIIVDGKKSLIATVEGDSPEYNACIYITDERISDGLEKAFNYVWRQV